MKHGRELTGPELKKGDMVVLATGGGLLVEVRVASCNAVRHEVQFYSPELGWVSLYRWDREGALYSQEHGRTVHVYEIKE